MKRFAKFVAVFIGIGISFILVCLIGCVIVTISNRLLGSLSWTVPAAALTAMSAWVAYKLSK